MCKAGRHGVTAKQLSYLSMGMDVVLQCFTSATHVHAADEAFMTNFPWVLDTMLFFMAWRTGWGHAITHLAVFVFACFVLVPNVFSHLNFVSLDVFATDPDSAFVNVLSLSCLCFSAFCSSFPSSVSVSVPAQSLKHEHGQLELCCEGHVQEQGAQCSEWP